MTTHLKWNPRFDFFCREAQQRAMKPGGWRIPKVPTLVEMAQRNCFKNGTMPEKGECPDPLFTAARGITLSDDDRPRTEEERRAVQPPMIDPCPQEQDGGNRQMDQGALPTVERGNAQTTDPRPHERDGPNE